MSTVQFPVVSTGVIDALSTNPQVTLNVSALTKTSPSPTLAGSTSYNVPFSRPILEIRSLWERYGMTGVESSQKLEGFDEPLMNET